MHDSDPTCLTSTDALKSLKYQPAQALLTSHLPPSWKVRIFPFTVGIRGSIDTAHWTIQLSHLGIPSKRIHGILQRAVDKTLDALLTIRNARYAALLTTQPTIK